MYGLNSWVVFPQTVQALRSKANAQNLASNQSGSLSKTLMINPLHPKIPFKSIESSHKIQRGSRKPSRVGATINSK